MKKMCYLLTMGLLAGSLKDEYGFNITYYEDSPTMYQAVLGGQVVACFEDTPIMASSIKDGDLALQILEDTANEGSPYGFAIFDADNQELLDMFNAGLKDIKESGEYNEIIAKYLGEDAVPTEEAADDAEADTTEAPAEEEAAPCNGTDPASCFMRSVFCLYSGYVFWFVKCT